MKPKARPENPEEPESSEPVNHHGEVEIRFFHDLDGDEGGGGAYGRPRDEDDEGGDDQPA